MEQLKEMAPDLTTMSDAITADLEEAAATEFEPLLAQGLFCDGWMMPKGHCAAPNELQRFLRIHELEVKMPIVS